MRTRWHSRNAALALALLIGLASVAVAARADELGLPGEPGVSGFGRLAKYSACATGIANSMRKLDYIQMASSWLFCALLFYEEKY